MPTQLMNQKESGRTGRVPRQSGLVGICTEVLENIIGYLDLDSIKTLRLTSKVLSEQCLVPRFKRCFEHLTTDLTPETLYSFSSLAASPQLRTAIRRLTIMATVYDTSQLKRTLLTKRAKGGPDSSAGTTNSECAEKEISTAEADLAWMQARQEQREAFSDESAIESLAKALGPLERLDSIELESIVIHGPDSTSPTEGDWRQVWFRALQAYRLTMSAIARSGVAVHSLNVFRRGPSQCSIPSCDITRHMAKLDIDDFYAAGSHIKDFSLSTSMKVETDPRKLAATLDKLKGGAYRRAVMRLGLYEADDPEAVAEDNFPGIANLLRCMPNLKSIDLRLRRTTLDGAPEAYEKIFTAIAEEVHMSMLRKCCLGGLMVNEESMLKFLGNHPRIEHLDLSEIHLISGSWQPIFEFLCSNMPGLKCLQLSNLWDQCDQPLVHLHPIWAKDFPIDYFCPDPWYHPYTGGMVVHRSEFDVDDLQKGLEFQPRPTGEILSSPLRYNWSKTRAQEYGPPS